MRKGKITMIITIGIACFALATVMTMQFKIVNETDITSIETMRKTELETELANWKSKYEETDAKYQETQEKINEYKRRTKSSKYKSGINRCRRTGNSSNFKGFR